MENSLFTAYMVYTPPGWTTRRPFLTFSSVCTSIPIIERIQRRKMPVRYANPVRMSRTTISRATVIGQWTVDKYVPRIRFTTIRMLYLIGQEPQPKYFPHVILSPSSAPRDYIFFPFRFVACLLFCPGSRSCDEGTHMGDIVKLSQIHWDEV